MEGQIYLTKVTSKNPPGPTAKWLKERLHQGYRVAVSACGESALAKMQEVLRMVYHNREIAESADLFATLKGSSMPGIRWTIEPDMAVTSYRLTIVPAKCATSELDNLPDLDFEVPIEDPHVWIRFGEDTDHVRMYRFMMTCSQMISGMGGELTWVYCDDLWCSNIDVLPSEVDPEKWASYKMHAARSPLTFTRRQAPVLERAEDRDTKPPSNQSGGQPSTVAPHLRGLTQ